MSTDEYKEPGDGSEESEKKRRAMEVLREFGDARNRQRKMQMPVLGMAEYRWLLRGIDPPTDHRMVEPDGWTFYARRTASSEELHYTSMSTDTYRLRFGRLQFACAAGSSISFPLEVKTEGGNMVK